VRISLHQSIVCITSEDVNFDVYKYDPVL